LSRKVQESYETKGTNPSHNQDTLVRILAAQIFETIKAKKCRYEEAVVHHKEKYNRLSSRDATLLRAIVITTCRHHGALRTYLAQNLKRPLPTKQTLLEAVLMTGAAQVLFLSLPDYAVVHSTVKLAKKHKHLRPFAPLVNALLRTLARQRDVLLKAYESLHNLPPWLKNRWEHLYGSHTTKAMADIFCQEPFLDVTVSSDPQGWCERLGALLLPTGSLRLQTRTPISELPGYKEGAWWVQDGATALSARLLPLTPEHTVLDLCAAPGGKTAQLALSGAHVIACDRSESRVRRLHENMKRLNLKNVEIECIDALTLDIPRVDAILLDAPCLATGTFRHHPDGLLIKDKTQLKALTLLQSQLLDKAASLLRPGGHLVYATCSLEPEEGEEQIRHFLERWPNFRRHPISLAQLTPYGDVSPCTLDPALLTSEGDLRILPTHLTYPDSSLSFWDGFFAAHLRARE
jgi:16S rRNA (cytosine967-C5)-methyltransferase